MNYNKEIKERYRKMRTFSIRKIVVHDSCDKKIRKILAPGEYVFTQERFDNFFIEGVSMCAVVGKNGCGKSSLIELLFRMINNLGAVMLRNFDRPAAEILYYVDGVVADLYFDLNSKAGCLCCDKEKVVLEHDGYYFNWNINDGKCKYKINDEEQQTLDFQLAKSVAEHFFYLIATNYSMQAYISDDYRYEGVYGWQQKKDIHGKLKEEYEWRSEQTGIWIDSVFHKNDGYMCPIVLNPYRSSGKIDMSQEGRLTVNRLCALLLQMQNEDFQIIDGYKLWNIKYKFDQLFLLNKFDRQALRDIPTERVSDKFLFVYLQDYSYAKAVLDGYGIDATKAMNYVELTLRLYLVYKTFSIASKYPQYSHFKPIGDVNNAFKHNPNQSELALAKELAERIKDRHSHIELKVHQTLDLIELLDKSKNKDAFDQPLTYEEYYKLLEKEIQCNSVMERMETLPPPLFTPTVYLVKTEGGNPIELSKLSSGERQFIYTTSTLLYHSFNLMSVPKDERLSYRNICMVLDEVEICFHPEYQRTFVNKLLTLLDRVKLNEAFSIHIIIVTHSPFVLSDMPKGNILYLDEGVNVTEQKELDTYGANVNEMLCQSFFLSSGFMGEFAKQKIESLVAYLKSDEPNDHWNQKEAEKVIELVGDEIIQYQLRQLYAVKFKGSDYYRNWIASEAKRLGL